MTRAALLAVLFAGCGAGGGDPAAVAQPQGPIPAFDLSTFDWTGTTVSIPFTASQRSEPFIFDIDSQVGGVLTGRIGWVRELFPTPGQTRAITDSVWTSPTTVEIGSSTGEVRNGSRFDLGMVCELQPGFDASGGQMIADISFAAGFPPARLAATATPKVAVIPAILIDPETGEVWPAEMRQL